MTAVDVEGGLRAWLRGELAGLVGNRVFVDVPPKAALPFVVITLIDAADDTSDAPLDVTLVQLDCYASNKRAAHTLYTTLRESLRSAVCGLTLTAGTTLKGVTVTAGTTYRPDDDGTARYIITAQVIVAP